MCALRWTDLGLELARKIGRLDSLQNVEIIIGGMSPRMTLGPNSRAEDDQVPTTSPKHCISLQPSRLCDNQYLPIVGLAALTR